MSIPFTRKNYLTSREKAIDFILGFIGCHLVNGLMLLIILLLQRFLNSSSVPAGVDPNVIYTMGCYFPAFLINLGGLIGLASRRRWAALGVLAAFAVYLFLALVASIFLAWLCFSYLQQSPGSR